VKKTIAMVDLGALHAPLLDELTRATAGLLAGGRFILGEAGAALEGELASLHAVRRAVGVSSGTDALLLMLMSAGVGSGDEVVTTPFSFFATVEAVLRLEARPVFVDIDPHTMNLDAGAAVARIGRATKAVLPVHLFGRPADLPRLLEVCAAEAIPVVEDAAQAIGAPGIGGGAAAALSFFPTKNLGGFGDGGMVLTNDAALAERLRLLRNHGAAPGDKLRHLVVGGNFRLDELQAALLRVKLPHLARWTAARRRIAALYARALPSGVVLPPPDERSVWNQYVVRVPAHRRAALAAHLAARGIASAIYYPVPLHLQPALAFLGHREGDFPNAEQAAREALALPIHPALTDDDVGLVAGAVADFFD
jgi:dTDP-4-amino-4,6-dideoxygalactose transaminase